MGEQVSLEQAESEFFELVDRAAAGEEFVIARNGRPVARLVAAETPVDTSEPSA